MGVEKVEKFEDLIVWQRSHKLAVELYKITKDFPSTEIYGLTSQIRRASTSVPANIVEGCYRNTTKEFIHFLHTARGSAGEVVYFLILIKDVGYINAETYSRIRNEYNILMRQLTTLIKSLQDR